MSIVSGGSDYDRIAFGSSPSSVLSFPMNQDNTGSQSIISSATTAANTILPPEQANINFKPTTTAVTKISKLKLQVSLDSTIYTAGGVLTGRLALTSSSARSLKLGEISVELTAYEELSVKEYTASQSFLSSRLVFQSENLPPSNAVQGPKENGYWMAKKGKTTFPFAFKIPIDAPSSVGYGSLASLKYVVTGVVQFMNNNREDTLFKSKEAFVVEAWDGHNSIYKQQVNEINMRQLWMGGSGAVTLEGTLTERLFQSGGNVSVQVRVKNETKRRVQGIKVAITHKLLILADKYKKEVDDVKVVGDTVTDQWFKSKDFLFDCGEDRSTTVHINVPKNVKTIRNTALFEVVCYVVVSLYLGPFTKDLTVHLPVYIAHSASLQPAPVADADLNVFPNHYNMMDENAEFFVEDIRKDDNDVLGLVSTPVNIPSKKGDRVLPWSNVDDDARGHYSPAKGSAGSLFGSASPKKIGSFASSLLGRPKQMSPPNPSKLVAKSPPLAPASPYAYIPAIERVRYLSFTTEEQGAIQKRPYAATSRLGGYGKHNGSQQATPPTSEYEFISSSPEQSKHVQKWLDKQQNDNQSERSSPALSDGDESVAVTPGGKSPWAHINNVQETVNNNSSTIPSSDLSVEQDSDFPSDSFKRNDNLASSPSGPSGLTLLMRQKAQMPKIQDNMFEEVISTTSSTYDAYENVPKGRPLPIPKPKEQDGKKSDLLQVPGLEQQENSNNSSNTNNVGGNLSSLFKWGTSWIGYGESNDKPQNSSASDISEKTQLQSIIEEDNTSNEISKNRLRRQLPSPPTTTSISPIQDETKSPKTRPRRSLPAPPTTVSQKQIIPNSPIIEKDENTLNNISNSPRNNFTKPLNIEQVNKVTPVTTEQQSPPKITSLEKSDKPSASPPKRSYLPITKASIFAALGQKPLGMFSSPSPAPVVPVVPVSSPSPPKKTLPVASVPVASGTSPPKQKEFNVRRKPVELNSLIKNEIKIAEMIKNELENPNENEEGKAEISTTNITDTSDIRNVSSSAINQVTTTTKPVKLAIPPPVPKKFIPTESAQVKSSIPIVPINTIDDKSDKNDDTNMSPGSPVDPIKILASPTTYVNTTIAKPVVALNGKDKDKLLEEKLLINNKKMKRKNNENGEEEGRLTAKITEPPKSVLSPRLQEYINKYNKATTSVDKN